MVKNVTEYTKEELEEKIMNIKAERERTAEALRKYEEELEHRKQEGPLGVPCDGEFYVSWDGVAIEDREEKAKEALRFYANGQHIDSASIGSSYAIRIEDGTKAKDCLKEIEE